MPEVVLRLQSGREVHVKVELARTEAERQRGLMFRQKLDGGTGMLFLFEHMSRLSFWMKNTYIPLDMLFFDDKKKLLYIEENAEPLTTNARGPDFDTQYVLEVPGGWCKSQGIEVGADAEFIGTE
jgi:uncharacterized membrane protein (UPF0127 family)